MAKKTTKKQVKKAGLHMEVHDIWGWVVLALGVLIIFSVAGYYYLSLV
jgi:hypothetical protein